MFRIRLNDQIMFSWDDAPDIVGFGAEDPDLQGLLHKVCVINEGQGEEVCNMHCMDILHKLSLP